MYLHFRLKSLRCIEGDDRWGDPDYYFTWQVYQDTQPEALLRQGFSIGVDIDEGHTVAKGEQITLTDTTFTVRLPTLQPGEQTRLWVDLFCWESDGDTAKVKKLFTDTAATKLWQLYEENQKQKEKTLKAFFDWLDKDGMAILQAALTAAGGAPAALMPIARSVFSLMKLAVQAISEDDDDLIGTTRTELIIARDASGKFRYRWITDNGAEVPIDREVTPYYQTPTLRDRTGKNKVGLNMFYQVIFDLNDRGREP
jgi:hypothetical protein